MRNEWSDRENDAIVADYMQMLAMELKGQPFSKREHARGLSPKLQDRTNASIEYKHANISAALIELGFPYVSGYKPRGNLQRSLAEAVEQFLSRDRELKTLAQSVIESDPRRPSIGSELASIFVRPPSLKRPEKIYERPAAHAVLVTAESYLDRESRNLRLGQAGEIFVLEVEERRLREAGHRKLAARVEHTARVRGDGLGYDILSFEESGAERYIEVKTTNFGMYSPFFASANEVRTSAELSSRYHLYRVFDFHRTPKIFLLNGALRDRVSLEPIAYRARI